MHNKLLLKLFNYNNKFNLLKKTSNLLIYNNTQFKTRSYSTEMDLKLVVKRLEQYANLKLSADWDNVGLLVEPSDKLLVKRILITNDLTEPVLEEAIKKNANLIISYHPAIFNPLKRLTQSEWKQRSIVKCIENRIAVYSPHTAWDSVEGGINDWILSVFDLKKAESIEPVKEAINPCGLSKTLKVNVDFGPSKDKLLSKLSGYQDNIRFVGEQSVTGTDSIKQVELEFLSSPNGLTNIIEMINSIYGSSVLNTLRIYDLDKPLMKNVGSGRIGYLNESISIRSILEKLKQHFKMKTIRLALANGKTLDDKVKVIGVCAGSGSRLLNNKNVDLLITGEFSHHEILHETHRGVSLVLTDHTNCERGHHEHFARKFLELLKQNNEYVDISISEIDRDPLEYF